MARWPWKQEEIPTEVAELEEGLQEVRTRLAQAYAGFNFADDGELVESYIYEIQALQARYSYLLRRRKAVCGGETSPLSDHRRPVKAAPVA